MVDSSWVHTLIAPLFVPGDRPERFAKAAASGANAVILDLEDAVATERKSYARDCVRAHELDKTRTIIRVNARTSAHFAADLSALKDRPFAALMLPKTERSGDVLAVHEALGGIVPIIPLIETALGVANLTDILATPGVCVAAFGSVDFALDLGCAHAWEPLLLARSEIVLRSRVAGLPAPIDGVTTVIDDAEIVERDAHRAVDMGFGGKLAIHPRQIAPISRSFLPDEHSLAWAEKVMAAVDSGGAMRLDGEMIDLPVIERAKRILRILARV